MVSVPGVPFDDPIPLGTGSTARPQKQVKRQQAKPPTPRIERPKNVGRCRECGAAIFWVQRHTDDRFNRPLEELSEVVVLSPFDDAVITMSYRFHHHTAAEVTAWTAKQEEGRDERIAQLHLKKALRRAYHPTWRNADEKEARERTAVKAELRDHQRDQREMFEAWSLEVPCPVPRCARPVDSRCVNLSIGPKRGQLTKWPHTDRLHQSPKWLAWFAEQTS